MSSSIWTRCAGDSRLTPLSLDPYRVVEAQHQVSTRKLVDSDAEQLVLERLIDTAKPPAPASGRLHYLLATPFRYPPLRHGSRFGTRFERGIWYGAETRRAAFAETAYYRLLFLEGTAADLGTIQVGLSVFRVVVRTDRGIDVTRPPFDRYRSSLASKTSYRVAQTLGAAMRAAGVEAFRYLSARDTAGGINIGVFSPTAFGRARPRGFERWHCSATAGRVEIRTLDYLRRDAFTFPREDFLVRGSLPAPAAR